MNLYEIVNAIETTSGTNAKIAIVAEHADDPLFQRMLHLELDPNTNFHMKKVPAPVGAGYVGSNPDGSVTYEDMFDFLDKLAAREISGNSAITQAGMIRSNITEEQDVIFTRLLQKNLKTKLGAKNVNKGLGFSFIKDTPYMRCELTKKKTLAKFIWVKENGTPNVASEVKMDGQYLNHIVRNGLYSAESRNGKPYDFMGVMDADFKRLAEILKDDYDIDNPVFNGEAVVSDGNGGVLERTTGNGIIQKFGKGTGNILDAQNVIAVLWDVLPYDAYMAGEWAVDRATRRTILESALTKLDSEKVRMVEYKMVSSFKEAYEYNTEMMSRGEEGTIIKDDRGTWKSHTSPWQLKMKLKFEIDLKVVGFEEGKAGKQFENSLGALIVESDCGMLRCKVGTGFKAKFDKKHADELVRDHIWANREELLGAIVTVEANDIVSDKRGNGILKLFLPVFVEWRHDKDDFDDIDRIRDMKEAAIIALMGE